VERSLLAFDPGRARQDRQQAGSGMSTEKKSIRKQEEKAVQLAAPVVAEAPVAQVCTHHLPVLCKMIFLTKKSIYYENKKYACHSSRRCLGKIDFYSILVLNVVLKKRTI
jgi:hypothetical protein